MNSKRIELRHMKSPEGGTGEITYAVLDHKADGTWRTSLEICLERYWHTRGVKRRHTLTIDLRIEDLDRILEVLDDNYDEADLTWPLNLETLALLLEGRGCYSPGHHIARIRALARGERVRLSYHATCRVLIGDWKRS